MSSINYKMQKKFGARQVVGGVVDDSPVGIRIRYKGTGTVTSVTVDTDQDITLVSVEDGATVTEEYTVAAYTTFGELVDAINTSSYWECKLLDALRADSTTGSPFVDNASVTISNDGYYDALIDTNVKLDFTYRVTVSRDVGVNKPMEGAIVKIREIKYNVDINGATNSGFLIYEFDSKKISETIIYRRASVDATDTVINFANAKGRISAKSGNDLIVRVINPTSLSDTAVNQMDVSYEIE